MNAPRAEAPRRQPTSFVLGLQRLSAVGAAVGLTLGTAPAWAQTATQKKPAPAAAAKPSQTPANSKSRAKVTNEMTQAPGLQQNTPAAREVISESEFDLRVPAARGTEVVDTKCGRLYDSADTLGLLTEFGKIFVGSKLMDAGAKVDSRSGSGNSAGSALGAVLGNVVGGLGGQMVQPGANAAAPGDAAARQAVAGDGDDVRRQLRHLARTKVWVPPSIEREIAKLLHKRYQREGSVIPTSALNSDRARRFGEVRDVLNRIVATLPADNPYQFELVAIRGSEVNAKVGVGGYVYVTEGLLDEDQMDRNHLALILAHEISHVTRRHAMKEFQVKLVDLVGIGKDLRSEFMSLGRNPLGQIAAVIEAGNAAQLMMVRYDHHQELEADACGMFVMARTPSFDAFRAMQAFVQDKAQASKQAAGRPAQPGQRLPGMTGTLAWMDASHPAYDRRRDVMAFQLDNPDQRARPMPAFATPTATAAAAAAAAKPGNAPTTPAPTSVASQEEGANKPGSNEPAFLRRLREALPAAGSAPTDAPPIQSGGG